jgi:hypothetical protein
MRRPNASWLVLPAYVLATLVLSWPLPRALSTSIPWGGRLADGPFQAFVLEWDARTLARDPARVFDPPIFHPETNTLTYMDHLIGETIVASPLLAASDSVAPGYDFLWLLSFVLSGWGAYRLARLFGASRGAAWLAGFLFAFCAYRWSFLDQLNQLQTQCFPFALEFAVRWLRDLRTKHLVALAAVFVVQVWFGWYYAFFLGLLVPFTIVWAIAFRWVDARRIPWATVLLVLAGVAVLVVPAALPYLKQAKAHPEFRRTLDQQILGSATVFDFLRSHETSSAWSRGPFTAGVHALWPGVVTLGLGAIGLADALSRRRRPGAVFFAALALGAFVLALGPVFHTHGHNYGPPLPYRLLFEFVPGFASMRSPARFGVLVVLALTMFAAFGWDALVRRGAIGRGPWGRAAQVALVAIAVVTSWPRPVGLEQLPTARTLPPAYAYLARQPGDEPMVDVPTSYEETNERHIDVWRQFSVLHHRKPRLDGASGFVSPEYRAFRVAMRGFPDAASLGAIAARGGVWVVLHWGDYADADRARVRARVAAEPSLRPVARFGDDEVFRLESAAYSNAREPAAVGSAARSAAP